MTISDETDETRKKRILLPITGGGFKFETMLLTSRLALTHDIIIVTNAKWNVEKEAQKLNALLYETPELNTFTQRNPFVTAWNFCKGLARARQILSESKPDGIVVVGTNVGVPLLVIGRLRGIPTFFIESITRVENLSFSTRLVVALGLSNKVYVQWPNLADDKRGILYQGTVL